MEVVWKQDVAWVVKKHFTLARSALLRSIVQSMTVSGCGRGSGDATDDEASGLEKKGTVSLFLKALTNREQEKQATTLAAGPEGAWLKDMYTVKAILKRQQSAIAMLFSSPHNVSDQQPLRQVITAIKSLVDSMCKEITP